MLCYYHKESPKYRKALRGFVVGVEVKMYAEKNE